MHTTLRLTFALSLAVLAACGSEPRNSTTIPSGDGGVTADGGGSFDGGGSTAMMIGPAGGMIQLGMTKVTIPPGAVTTPTMYTVTEVNPTTLAAVGAGFTAVGPALAFLPHGTTFQMPVTIEVPYSASEGALVLRGLDNEADTSWSEHPTATFQNGVARLSVTHFCIKQACTRGATNPTPEICNNNMDDGDEDLLSDCADPECIEAPNCITHAAEICDNNVDDDGDQLTDCFDVQNCCASRPACCEINSACFELHLCGG